MTECGHEREVIRAAKSNQWTASLRDHIENCPLCRETLNMVTMIKKISDEYATHALPGYRLIWLKAQYARKQERLSLLDFAALAGMSLAGIAGLAGLLLWRFPQTFTGIIDSAAASLIDFKSVLSNGAPLLIIAGVLVMVWVLSRDTFFAKR